MSTSSDTSYDADSLYALDLRWMQTEAKTDNDVEQGYIITELIRTVARLEARITQLEKAERRR